MFGRDSFFKFSSRILWGFITINLKITFWKSQDLLYSQMVKTHHLGTRSVLEHFKSVISNSRYDTNFCASVFKIAFCVRTFLFYGIPSWITFILLFSLWWNLLVRTLVQRFLWRLFQLLKLSKHTIQFSFSNYRFCWRVVDFKPYCSLRIIEKYTSLMDIF